MADKKRIIAYMLNLAMAQKLLIMSSVVCVYKD